MFNLRTGTLMPHGKEYFATYMLPIKSRPTHAAALSDLEACPEQWMGDPAVIQEAQKYAGYCLTRRRATRC